MSKTNRRHKESKGWLQYLEFRIILCFNLISINMKKIFVILFLSTIALGAKAQNDAITKFFGKYEDDMSFTVVNITSRMFNMFTDLEVENEEDKEVLEAISKLTGLKILAKDEFANARALYKEANVLIPQGEYDELMTIRDEDKNMRFLVKEKDKKISELLMVMGGEKEFFILSLVGDIDLNQIAKLSQKMDVDGLENLEKLKDHKSSN